MDWQDTGIVLSVRRHGESSAIVSLLTRENGRHAGMVQGAKSAANRGVLQQGNLVQAHWRARLADHLGTFKLEPLAARAAPLLTHPGKLAALTSACAICELALPERENATDMFDLLADLTAGLVQDDWAVLYAHWELAVLTVMAFRLDLSHCAATGVTEDLVYVSPRTGRAVSSAAGQPYHDRLFPLPAFLRESGAPRDNAELIAALRLTGHFLGQHVIDPTRHRLPDPRERLVTYLEAENN